MIWNQGVRQQLIAKRCRKWCRLPQEKINSSHFAVQGSTMRPWPAFRHDRPGKVNVESDLPSKVMRPRDFWGRKQSSGPKASSGCPAITAISAVRVRRKVGMSVTRMTYSPTRRLRTPLLRVSRSYVQRWTPRAIGSATQHISSFHRTTPEQDLDIHLANV